MSGVEDHHVKWPILLRNLAFWSGRRRWTLCCSFPDCLLVRVGVACNELAAHWRWTS